MSSPAIDQIFQIAAPVRSAIESTRPTVSAGPDFQKHLDRASSETKSPKATDPVEADSNDLTSTDQQPNTTSSQEDETLIPADSAITDEQNDPQNQDLAEEDVIELSGAAIAIANNPSSENEVAIVLQQPQSSDTQPSEIQSENPEGGENTDTEEPGSLLKSLGSENEHFDDLESNEKSALPAENNAAQAIAGKSGQENENQAHANQPAVDIESGAEVVDKTEDQLADEQKANARNNSETPEKAILTTESTEKELSRPEKQAAQQQQNSGVDTQTIDPELPVDQKPAERNVEQQNSNPHATATQTESEALQENQSNLTAENRPSVTASTPALEPTAPLALPVGEDASGSQRLVEAPSVASAEAPTEGEPVPTADRARFIQRVGGAIRSAQNRDGEIHLQLRPPELGSLRIEISVKQGVLTAHLETETSAARAILLDNLPALRERLAEQEIRIEKFDVDVRDESGRQSENQGTEDRKTNRPPEETRSRHQSNDERQSAAATPATFETSPTLSGGLDVRI